MKIREKTLPERLILGAAFTMFAGMLVATLAQVLFRYFLQISVPWTEEVARTFFVLSILTGIAIAYAEREHIIIDFIFLRFSPGIQRLMTVIFAVGILILLAFWARGALEMANRNWDVFLITITWFRVAYFYIWELGMITLLAIYVLLDLKSLVTGEMTSLLHSELEEHR